MGWFQAGFVTGVVIAIAVEAMDSVSEALMEEKLVFDS